MDGRQHYAKFDFMNGSWYSGFLEDNTTDEVPRAFLNAILLDNNLQLQRNGEDYIIDVEQVSAEARIPEDGDVYSHTHELLEVELEVQQEGYIYIYVSNEDKQDMDVYFPARHSDGLKLAGGDDLKVTHKLNDIVGGGDYYPYGSVMAGRQITRDDYRFGYQGQFSEYDEETGWNAFELRIYDSKIGRWLSTDPAGQFASPYLGMGNNPINVIDPDGRAIIFIGGFHYTFGPTGSRYWGDFANKTASIYGEDINKALWADGQKGITPYERKTACKLWARANIETIKQQVKETHQLILVSHSMGGAFADGVAEELESQGIDVDLHVAIAPWQDEFINVNQTPTFQFVNESDRISGNSLGIEGDYVRGFLKKGGSHFLNDFNWVLPRLRKVERRKATIEVGEIQNVQILDD